MARTRTVIGRSRHMYGWRPDLPDHRDCALKAPLYKAIFLPRQVDLRKYCTQVENQGDIGSCTANATTSAVEFLMKKSGKKYPELSRLFLYYATRVWIAGNDPSTDDGATLRDAMKAMAQFGTCQEHLWAYDPTKWTQNPPQAAKKDALNHQIIRYYRCEKLRDVRTCLSQGYPCVGGFSVPESIDGATTCRTGRVIYPKPEENFIGGHAVLFVGYDDKRNLLIFQNSWGKKWGDEGFGYLPYDFVKHSLAGDFWTIRQTE